MSLTPERVRELFHYDPETGLFTRLVKTAIRVNVGDVAGSKMADGYLAIEISNKPYKAHRLAWLYVYGEWPVNDIDHINGARDDNRICNLRDVTRSVNNQNQKKARSSNKAGMIGASLHGCGKYQSQIKIAGKSKYLGLFATPEDAHNAYVDAKRIHHVGNTL